MSLSVLPALGERTPTEQQLRLLQWIASFIAIRGYCPTFGEVAAGFQINQSTAITNVETVRRRGWATWELGDKSGRTLHLTEKGKALLASQEHPS